MSKQEGGPQFYKFHVSQLEDELYHPHVPVSKWLSKVEFTSDPKGFSPNSLNQLDQTLEWDVNVERTLGIALYMLYNVLPFALPLLLLVAFLFPLGRYLLYFVLSYTLILDFILRFFFVRHFIDKYKIETKDGQKTLSAVAPPNDIAKAQFLYTERNSSKYLSVKFVWPASLHRPNFTHTPLIFCVIPHGAAPIGITSYPIWSRIWNDRLCRWGGAPILFKIPLVSKYIKRIGYIPALKDPILDTLTKKEENVGLILDGIDGMFHPPDEEIASIKKRKGIVKIALRAGVPIVPVYAFGHTSLWTVVVDPFGIMKWISGKVGASFTPFFGRWGWFLGPPRRVPVAMCLGEPIRCPRMSDPSKDDVDKYHSILLDAYENLFETHKAAYGWSHKHLKFV